MTPKERRPDQSKTIGDYPGMAREVATSAASLANSQGPRFAPPEAPANGKAFGEGIDLADRACISAAS